MARAVHALEQRRNSWVQTTFWQQIEAHGILFQAEGDYLAAPGQRMRLNLALHFADSTGELEIICDGATYWEVLKLGAGEQKTTKVTKVDWKQALESLRKTSVGPQVQTEFFPGLLPLLQGLQERLTFTALENVDWKGKKAVQLTGEWSAEIGASIPKTVKQPWPDFLPRKCLIVLDAETYWPWRLEWWGPAPPRKQDALILQMEFRHPSFEALGKDQAAARFTFDPGAVKPDDATRGTIEELARRAQQLLSQKKKGKK